MLRVTGYAAKSLKITQYYSKVCVQFLIRIPRQLCRIYSCYEYTEVTDRHRTTAKATLTHSIARHKSYSETGFEFVIS